MKKTIEEEMEKQIGEHLEEHEHHGYHERPYRRIMVRVGSILVILLMVGYSIFSLVDVSGLLRSEAVEENALQGEVSILFLNGTLAEIQGEYLDNQEREIKACLFGTYENQEYRITSVEFPDISTASVVHISTPPCHVDALIDLHSHPWHKCTASQQDLSVFSKLKESDPNKLMMVMCSLDRFSVYS